VKYLHGSERRKENSVKSEILLKAEHKEGIEEKYNDDKFEVDNLINELTY